MVDDPDKSASFDAGAAPRRSNSTLGNLFALTGPACSETMLAWNSTSTGEIMQAELHWYEATGIGKREMKIKAFI